MAWAIEYRDVAQKQLSKLDHQTSRRITSFLEDRLAALDHPRLLGDALTGRFKGYWRYRVGDHRILCEFHDQRLVVLVLKIGDRKEVYRR